jgi:intracellular multiplication protein IcmG
MNPEEEYQLPNTDSQQKTTVSVDNKKSSPTKAFLDNVKSTLFKQENLPKLGIGLAVLFVLFIFYSFLTSNSDSKEIIKTQEVPMAVSAPLAMQNPTQTMQQTGRILRELQAVKKELISDIKQIQVFDGSSVSSLNFDTSIIENKLDKINSRLDALDNKINEKFALMDAKMTPKVDKTSKAKIPAVKPKILYTISAIIHGRAWLESKDGASITVKHGDIIPEYGEIKLIEPEQGIVVTSSGKVITFEDTK